MTKDLKNSKNFCVAPWMHLHVINNGESFPCCMTPIEADNSFGNIKEKSLLEVYNSPKAKGMRKDMLEGKPLPKSCERCVSRELHGITSMRQGMNGNWYDRVKDYVDKTNEDGSVDSLNFKYWDFRFSNYCNLSCRTCGPLFSTAWARDYLKLNIDDQETGLINVDDADIFFEGISENVHTIKEIMFAGGEPIIMNEHWKMIELFEEKNLYDIELKYSTNATLLHRGKKNLLDIWPKFRRVHLSLSIDGVDETFNYVRNGGEWGQVEKNLLSIEQSILKYKDNKISQWIHPTVSNLNIFRFTELHEKLFNLGIIPVERKYDGEEYDESSYFIQRFHINPLFVPSYYSTRTLPNELKEQASDKIKKYADRMYNDHGVPKSGFENIINFMWEEDKSDEWKAFVNMTKRLDTIRKQNIFDINPEFKGYFNED